MCYCSTRLHRSAASCLRMMHGPSKAFSPIHCDVSTPSASLQWYFFSDWILYRYAVSEPLVVVSSRFCFEYILLFIDCTWWFPLICSHLVYSWYFWSLLLIVLVLQFIFKPSWWSRSTQSSQKSARRMSHFSWLHAWYSTPWAFGVTFISSILQSSKAFF
jgi:hypothetical protein